MRKTMFTALMFLFFSCGDDRLVDVPDGGCIAFAEECNNFDDDCDGIVDNNLPVRPCYPRSQEELVPVATACRFGMERCAAGQIRCVNWIGPTTETCNSKDDDCDGDVDEGLSKEIDIVVALDYSCSMDDRISEVSEGLINWGAFHANNGIRVALVGIPGPDYAQDGIVVKLIDFTDPQNFSRTVDPLKRIGGGLEPSIDVIQMCSAMSPPAGLSPWNPTAGRALLVVTDELPQTRSTEDYVADESLQMTVRSDAAAANLRVLVMTNQQNLWKLWSTSPFVPVADFPNVLDNFITTGRCP